MLHDLLFHVTRFIQLPYDGVCQQIHTIAVGASKMNAEAKKCDRCWYYSESVGMATDTEEGHDHSDLCLRCHQVVKEDGYNV